MVAVSGLGKRGRLFDVSFEFEQGSLALIGPNGAGKSTLLSILAGRIKADGGEAKLFGSPPRSLNAAKLRAYLPQQVAFPVHLRAREILQAARQLKGLAGGALAEAVARMHLEPVLDKPVGTLSGGMRQRLALAAGLMGGARLWLLDEPAAAIDPGGFSCLQAWLSDHRRSGGTVIISAHRPEEVAALATEALLLRAGRLIHRAKVEDLYRYVLSDGRRLDEVLPGARLTREPVAALREALYEEDDQ
jgi:ABC-type multidrug transport system ATPase subunit